MWHMMEQVANYKQPLELLDTMDSEKRTNIVFKSIRKNTITLMTRAYGRGTGVQEILFVVNTFKDVKHIDTKLDSR